ncbi:helix-turn-helix domain-containing protein [uncultured Ferrimonas sp.]|uniref:Crp/Fnr family transcriptional regulator n=1 Tax=uncultured Ferrimonas sp. TaxID=432640 RepID=UPI00261A5E11|nr:helix-turn-helix domain-containing protein [uncultured Ferrimonas sp.]
MSQDDKPNSNILSLSKQLLARDVEPQVVAELLKSSYSISFKKGDVFRPSLEDAQIIYFRSGCMVEVLALSDDKEYASSVWTAGYIIMSLPRSYNRFENHSNHYHCLFDSELTVIPAASVQKQFNRSRPLANYVLSRASEYLYTSHDMALLRSTLDKRENIILRLIVLYIRTPGIRLKLTIDDLCLLTNSTRQYCGEVLKQLQQDNIVHKRYGCIEVLDQARLIDSIDPNVMTFLSNYMALDKPQ